MGYDDFLNKIVWFEVRGWNKTISVLTLIVL
jgi:hypothetical protein